MTTQHLYTHNNQLHIARIIPSLYLTHPLPANWTTASTPQPPIGGTTVPPKPKFGGRSKGAA